MSRLSQELPTDILDNVLARLPVHVLCRLRLVCKRWNRQITHPGFAFLHARAPRQVPYVLISPKVMRFDPGAIELYRMFMMNPWNLVVPDEIVKMGKRRNWEILDLAEKRFYTLSDSFIEDCLREKVSEGEREYLGWVRYTLAADGGLIYALYHGGLTQIRRHIVCNPVSKKWHQIPEPGEFRCKYNQDIVVMSVDNVGTQSYKIITMDAKNKVRSRPEEVHLYDSTAAQWRMLCEVPANCRAWSSIFLKDIFYTLFVDVSRAPWFPKLYSCDLETGAWSYVDVKLPRPSHLQDKSQLVVSLGRLFFVEYTGVPLSPSNHTTTWENLVVSNPVKNKQLIKVSISEILLAEKDVIKVAEMPKYSKYPRRMLDRPQLIRGNPVVAVGCGDSVVISSLLGRRVGFDLLKNCWHELPANTGHMYETNRRDASENQGMFAGLIDPNLKEM